MSKFVKLRFDVLDKYTKEMQLEALRGNLKRLRSKMKADQAGLAMDDGRRDRAIKELEYCVIKAQRSGLVIYPQSADWKETPDIDEGASVRHDQVLLLMPDLSQMQVKVSIHESLVDRVLPGLSAKISLPEIEIEGAVKKVATIAQPAGWWTGNNVKYDTLIELPQTGSLKPRMSCVVEIIIARHHDVLTIPVSAVVETDQFNFCWVKTPDGIERRPITLGDSNDVFIIVESGLNEGDEVILNPMTHSEDAKGEALKTRQQSGETRPPTASSSKTENQQTGKTNAGVVTDNALPANTRSSEIQSSPDRGSLTREMEASDGQ